ncbi:MAG: cytochrome c oxidase subunit II, partial [Candidatus Limnocylindrales bacterium]
TTLAAERLGRFRRGASVTPRSVAVVAVSAMVVSGCMPEAATAQAKSISQLYSLFLAAAAVVLVVVWGGATLAIIRSRRRRDPGLPTQTRGSLPLELAWTIIPALVALGLFVATVAVLDRVDAETPTPAVQLQVTAFRWGWRFDFAEPKVEISGDVTDPPVLHLPVGEPIHVTITALDVDHSFYVPAFLFKRDAIPGLSTTFDLDIDTAGTYAGQCAEFCGIGHDQMTFTIVAEPVPAFQAWLAAQP